ncbi:TPA: hypothetical protein ACH3X2_001824 [Trebouxia sp. C0005]
MLDTRHCRATIIKSGACTPATAAASVRRFVQQEVEIAPDVHRNLKLAIAALEDLEGHRTSAVAASARVQPEAASHKPGVTPAQAPRATPATAASHKPGVTPAQTPRATPATARLPAQGMAAGISTQTKSTKSDQHGKKTKKRTVET